MLAFRETPLPILRRPKSVVVRGLRILRLIMDFDEIRPDFYPLEASEIRGDVDNEEEAMSEGQATEAEQRPVGVALTPIPGRSNSSRQIGNEKQSNMPAAPPSSRVSVSPRVSSAAVSVQQSLPAAMIGSRASGTSRTAPLASRSESSEDRVRKRPRAADLLGLSSVPPDGDNAPAPKRLRPLSPRGSVLTGANAIPVLPRAGRQIAPLPARNQPRFATGPGVARRGVSSSLPPAFEEDLEALLSEHRPRDLDPATPGQDLFQRFYDESDLAAVRATPVFGDFDIDRRTPSRADLAKIGSLEGSDLNRLAAQREEQRSILGTRKLSFSACVALQKNNILADRLGRPAVAFLDPREGPLESLMWLDRYLQHFTLALQEELKRFPAKSDQRREVEKQSQESLEMVAHYLLKTDWFDCSAADSEEALKRLHFLVNKFAKLQRFNGAKCALSWAASCLVPAFDGLG
jgi:hypothetical protein